MFTLKRFTSKNISSSFGSFYFSTSTHSKFCIVGGGTAGINVAAQLLKDFKVSSNDIRIFEPSTKHHYQPGWTMVGGGLVNPEFVVRKQADMIPNGVAWTQQAVEKFNPENNTLYIQDGSAFTYDQLIVATGITNNYDGIKGFKEALDDPNSPVGSIYNDKYAAKFQNLMKNFKGGKAIFTFPPMPIKCPGAPQKVLYLSEEHWRKNGVRDKITIDYNITIDVIFGVKKYADELEPIAKSKGINLKYKYALKEVRSQERIAVFEDLTTKQTSEHKYDLLHAVPPMVTPEAIRKSPFVDATGYVDVDQGTMQSTKYPNVWSLGDCSSLPTRKTAAAIFSQTPILLKHMMSVVNKERRPDYVYNGYTSCPIFVGDDKLMLCEFIYNVQPLETFGNQQVPKRFYYWLKRYLFPFAYFNIMPNGRWYGKHLLWNPVK